MARFWIGTEITRYYGNAFPYSTFAINVLGSFVIGVAAVWSDNATVRYFVMVGICGGFTTFSTFSLDTLALIRLGAWQRAAVYVLLSVGLCLAATLAGALSAKGLRN